MRITARSGRYGIGLFAACAVGATFTAVLSPTPAAAGPDLGSPRCVSFTALNEKVLSATSTDNDPKGLSLTDSGGYTNALIDAHGKQIGTATGSSVAVLVRASDNHVMAFNTNVDKLIGGDVTENSVMDATGTVAGATVTEPAVGTSGRYLGMTGARTYRRIDPQTYVSSIVLCH
ncbi:allene oxide cyclase barrel-like domain-containing protein [Streptomyces sp. NRRL F-525]|uniref:allene oxide cyclase barrel-like domain-containing protein n=1 Tax=Streptomyces sp. NRRL F-525 TaxID=1463861 RepID=UPI0005249358|nr:hypothetical protein [Streptomyces sp. NRRL F-525]